MTLACAFRVDEKAIASSAMLSGAINGIGGALLGIGAVDLFIHLGEGAYNLYEKYVSLKDVMAEPKQ